MTYKYNPFWQQRIRETVRHALDVHPRLTALRVDLWICPYISRHLLSLNPLLACCRRYSRGER